MENQEKRKKRLDYYKNRYRLNIAGYAEKMKKKQNDLYRNDDEWREHHKDVMRQRLSTPAGKIYNRVNAFIQRHPELAYETALEAKRKYLATGYIPNYIKNDDLESENLEV